MTTLSFTNIIVLSYNSLSYAAILFLLASGLSLIFGVMRIVNLAHAAFFLFAGYLALEFYNNIFGSLSLMPRIIQLVSWALLYSHGGDSRYTSLPNTPRWRSCSPTSSWKP